MAKSAKTKPKVVENPQASRVVFYRGELEEALKSVFAKRKMDAMDALIQARIAEMLAMVAIWYAKDIS